MGNVAQCPPGGPGGEVSLLPVNGTTETEAIVSFHLQYPGASNDALCTDGTSYYVRLDRLSASPTSDVSGNSKDELIWLIQRKQDAVVSFLSQVSQDRLDLSTALKAKAQLDEQESSSSAFGRTMTGLGAYLGGVGFAWGAFGVGVPALTDLMANREFQQTLRERNLCVNPQMLNQPQAAGSFFKKPFFLAHAAAAAGYGGYQLYDSLSADSPLAVDIEDSPVALDDVKHYSQEQLEKMSLSELQEVSRRLNVTVSKIGRVRRDLADKRIPIQDQMTRANLDLLAQNKSFIDKLMPHMPELVFGGTAGTIIGFGPFNHKWQRFYNSTSFHQKAAFSESSVDQLLQAGILMSCEGQTVETEQASTNPNLVPISEFTEADYLNYVELYGAPSYAMEDLDWQNSVPVGVISFFSEYDYAAAPPAEDRWKWESYLEQAANLLAERYASNSEEDQLIRESVGKIAKAYRERNYSWGTGLNLMKWTMQWYIYEMDQYGYVPDAAQVDDMIGMTETGPRYDGVVATYFKIMRKSVQEEISFDAARQAHWSRIQRADAYDELLADLKSKGIRPATYKDFQERLSGTFMPSSKEAMEASFNVAYEGNGYIHTKEGLQVFIQDGEWVVMSDFEKAITMRADGANAGVIPVMPMPVPLPAIPIGAGAPAFAIP